MSVLGLGGWQPLRRAIALALLGEPWDGTVGNFPREFTGLYRGFSLSERQEIEEDFNEKLSNAALAGFVRFSRLEGVDTKLVPAQFFINTRGFGCQDNTISADSNRKSLGSAAPHFAEDVHDVTVDWAGYVEWLYRIYPQLKPAIDSPEHGCRQWLIEEITKSPTVRPKTKIEFLEQAQGRWKGLSRVAFDRAWKDALSSTTNPVWDRPGRPKKNLPDNPPPEK